MLSNPAQNNQLVVPETLSQRANIFVALIIGICAFLIFAGKDILDPTNISWLVNGDPATNYIGWRFFAQSDWSFPPGANPTLGLELSRSIVFSDALPLLAIPFKAIDGLLPAGFQYFGWWICVIFVAQAVMASKLMALITNDKIVVALGTALFASTPALLHRLMFEGTMHIALSSHFLILAAIYLLIKPHHRFPSWQWQILLVGSLLIHFYLFAMVALFWVCALIDTVEKRDVELIKGFVLIALFGWLSGYLIGNSNGSSQYGYFHANLLTFFDPSGWSYLLPDLPEGAADYEGFGYLGLGMLIAGAMALVLLIAKKAHLPKARRWQIIPFVLATLFAITNVIGFGAYSFTIPLPEFLTDLAGILRASGRMIWPLYYILILGTLYVIATSLSRRAAIGVLTAILAIQLADTSAYWTSERNPLNAKPAHTWETAYQDPFWSKAAQRYKKVLITKPGNATGDWKEIGLLGTHYPFATNAVYLSRMGESDVDEARTDLLAVLQSGNYADDTLYILDKTDIDLARSTVDPKRQALLQIDGRYVVAPGWQN